MTTNPQKGDVEFEAGGKKYVLRYSHLSLVKLEHSLDKGLMQIMADVAKPETMRLGTIVSLLWAGLQKHQPGMTEEQAADLLDEIQDGAAGALAVIDEAFGKAFGTTPGTKGTNPTQKDANGAGTVSSWNSPVTVTTPKSFGN